MADKFPFAFDFGQMGEAFKMPALDKIMAGVDMTAFQDAQQKNMAALVEANKAAIAGYQSLYKRQTEIFEAALADAKDRASAVQGKPVTMEALQENLETFKTAIDAALADVKEVSEMAQKANTDAFDILKGRAEEAFAEMKAATEKALN